MKKFAAIVITLALFISVFCIQTGGEAFAEEVSDGFNVRSDYLAEITYTNFNMANGSIIRTFALTFDKDYFNSFEEGALVGGEQLLNYVSGYILAIGFKPEKDEKGRVIGSKIYDSATDLYLEYGINGYEPDDSDYDRRDGFLYSDITSVQKTIFDGIDGSENSFGMLLGILYMFNLERQDIALSYHYGSPYKIITTDAERSYFDTNSEIFIHEFYMDLDSAGREIKISQRIPNATNWYLLAVAIALPIALLTLMGMAVSVYKKRRRGYAD